MTAVHVRTQHRANLFGVQFLPHSSSSVLVTGAMDHTVQLHSLLTAPDTVARDVKGSGLAPQIVVQPRTTVYSCHTGRVKVRSSHTGRVKLRSSHQLSTSSIDSVVGYSFS
jgi:hypothetical protein